MEFLKTLLLVLHFLYINDLSDDVICMYADDMLDSKSDQAPDLWEQLELIVF